jgi:oligoendopeptidase F
VKIGKDINKKYQRLAHEFDVENEQHVSTTLATLSENPPTDFQSATQWFDTFAELSDAANEIQTELDLRNSLEINNHQHSARLSRFEGGVLKRLMDSRASLMDIYLKSPWRSAMHADDRGKIARELMARRKYTSPLLSDLQLEENALVREYKRFSATATCRLFGRQTPIGVVIGKFNDPRPDVRKEAFHAHWKTIRVHQQQLENLFTELLKNRLKQAEVAGAHSYVDLCFSDLGRFDYGAAECSELRQSILQRIVPLVSNLQSHQTLSLETPTLRPWDANSWPRFTPSEQPSQGNLIELLDACERILEKIEPGFGSLFKRMRSAGDIDIEPRPDKAPGAFCVVFPESRKPFVFGNFAGHFRDAFTLLHEFGHALHGAATVGIKNPLLRHPGLEFCEVASMGLEFLAQPFLNEFWPRSGDAQKAWKLHCFNALQFWPFMALIDEWQHTIYENAILDAGERNAIWAKLSAKYRPHLDWSGLEEVEELGWLSRPHPMTSPFYYIDYGIAQMGALQLWASSKIDYRKAVEGYVRGLSLGAQRSLPELFAAAELKFDFSSEWVGALGQMLYSEILQPEK